MVKRLLGCGSELYEGRNFLIQPNAIHQIPNPTQPTLISIKFTF
jgi:hypothetical protein